MRVLGYNWAGRKVLVTGAAGFKASWLCAALNRLGASIYGTVRRAKSPQSAFSVLRLAETIETLPLDVSDQQAVDAAFKRIAPEVVFHMAAMSTVPECISNPRRAYEINYIGALNVLEACRANKSCRRLIYCSTDHVFGSGDDLTPEGRKETSRLHYGGPYDTSKAVAELTVRSHHQTYWADMPSVAITRCANVIGYGDTNPRRVVPDFIRCAIGDKRLVIKSPATVRQFIHVTDSTAGYIRAASAIDEESSAKKSGDVPKNRDPFTPTSHFAIERYEGTRERYITIGQLADQIAEVFDAEVDRTQAVPLAANENKAQALNCDRTREVLNWRVRKPLREALLELGEYYAIENNSRRVEQLLDRDLTAIETALEIPLERPAAKAVELASVGN